MNYGKQRRANELEAKLVKVRKWLESDDCDGTELLHWSITLREILGERK